VAAPNRTGPDRTGERARRAWFDTAQEWIDSSVTLASTLTKRSTLAQAWAAYKDDLRKRGRLEETINNYEPMMRDTVIPKYGRREIGLTNTAVIIEDMLDHLARERGGSAPHILRENGAALSLDEAVTRIAAATGRPYRYEPETVEEAFARRWRPGMSGTQIETWISWYQAIERGELSWVTDVVPQVTGSPATPISDAAWWPAPNTARGVR
jgi:hypothetical protein